MLVALQNAPVIVTLIDRPSDQTTFADVLLGAFGITGVLIVLALGLGVLLAVGMVAWNKHHRPDQDHLPPITY